MTKYRIGVWWDAAFCPHGCDGRPLPESAEVYAASPMFQGGRELTHDDYCRYWGNPDRHLGAGVTVERLQAEDRDWVSMGGVWGIDLMDDSPEADVVPGEDHRPRYFYPDAMPPGYLGEVARRLLGDGRGRE